MGAYIIKPSLPNPNIDLAEWVMAAKQCGFESGKADFHEDCVLTKSSSQIQGIGSLSMVCSIFNEGLKCTFAPAVKKDDVASEITQIINRWVDLFFDNSIMRACCIVSWENN